MRRNARCPRPEVLTPRRGNSIVLVMGILVLLVIIATAFITRTHAGRVTANSAVRATLRDDNARAMSEMLAQEIALALFTRPIDPTDPQVILGNVATSDFARLSARRNPIRYGVDQDVVINNTGFPGSDGIPDFPYNFAPYMLVPYTNPPDPTGILDAPLWPSGPGNPGPTAGNASPFLAFEGNPVGNPGFGDARWLADHEPLRWVSPGLDGIPGTLDDFEAFSHWRHMTNIAHANNGFRIVLGIHDVGDLDGDGIGALVLGLADPVEQWLAVMPQITLGVPMYNALSGNAVLDELSFFNRWDNWFFNYATNYLDPTLVPPNFYDLGDLDGDGFAFNHPEGDRPQDEFVAGSARHAVSSILADTDGDGFTDSFWYLAPTMTERGIRQVVAVRIIDNSAMLNANVATRFIRNDTDTGFSVPGSKTAGHTPADVALVAQLLHIPVDAPVPPNWNVGILDNPANHELVPNPFFYGDTIIGYDVLMWDTRTTPQSGGRALNYLQQIGVIDQDFNLNPNFSTQLNTAVDRLTYWQFAGLRPLTPVGGLTPFGFTEELELRMFNGQNSPWIASRFERAVQANVLGSDGVQFLHANLGREESSEYLDQLRNAELAFDHRRNLTMYNGARNDLMPPWLWWPMVDVPQFILIQGQPAIDNFVAQSRIKLDLRDPEFVPPAFPPPGVLSFRERLPLAMLRALTDGFDDQAETYYQSASSNADKIQRLAASMAANILAYRDDDTEAPLEEAVALSEFPGVALPDDTVRFLGLERQPFLLEAFIAHVHASGAIPEISPPPLDPPQFFGFPGNYVDNSHEQSTIVVVQIANPFDGEPRQDVNGDGAIDENDLAIDLFDYSISVFGQTIDLATVVPLDRRYLRPGTAQRPRTAIFYSIESNFDGDAGFQDEWRDFLDLNRRLGADSNDLYFDPTLPLDRTILVDVNVALPGWSTARGVYDGFGAGYAIELLRRDPFNSTPVVVDRFDYNEDHPLHDEFRDVVAARPVPPVAFQNEDATPPELAGIRIGEDDFWVTWARVTRAWGRDFNYDAGDTNTHGIQPNERAPRFVFATQRVTTGNDTLFIGDQNATPADDGPELNCGYCGDSYDDADGPDDPWFDKEYTDATDLSRPRKPTFFNMNPVFDLDGNDIYPDFADPTYGYGSYFYGVSYPNGSEPGAGIPGKGFYHFSHSLQMLQKDGDFEQVGELLNVWLFGHELQFNLAGDYAETLKTFSEFMSDSSTAGTGTAVNRLRVRPTVAISPIIGKGDPLNLLDPLHAVPALPAGLRVLDAFVCDNGGINPGDVDGDGTPNTPNDIALVRFGNANGYRGKNTPGLININTAPLEVLRSAPHMTRLVHEIGSPSFNPLGRVPEAIMRYRERFGDPTVLSLDFTPDYGDRGDDTFIADLRGERGFASIGEIRLLNEDADGSPPADPDPDLYKRSFTADFAARDPFGFDSAGQPIESTQISTDVNDVFDQSTGQLEADGVAQDVEELNLLFSGMSNMLTTRSDVFTVYFRVRSFIQNPTTGVWDATNPEFIVDDSRYVMLVDRSEVNHPNDKPKILYLEKLPK